MAQQKRTEQEIQVQRTRNPLLTILSIIIGLFLLSLLFAGILSIAVLFSGSSIDDTGNVAVIQVKGPISIDGTETFGTGTSSTNIVKQIQEANEDPLVQAIVIEINSPGGSPVASAEIVRAVRESTKPSVAWIREEGASGAYWIASSAEYSIAHPLSITGSIGVYGSYLDFSKFLEDKNITYQRLVSGDHKDTGSPLRALSYSEEQLMQAKLDAMHNYFIASVAENRNLSEAYVREYADGMFLLGEEAVAAKLIDEVGSEPEVRKYLENTLNISTVDYKYYYKKESLRDIFFGMSSEHGFAVGEGIVSQLEQDNQNIRT